MKAFFLALALLVCASGGARAELLAPSPYLSFSMSPFAGMSFRYFHLETFEDGQLNTPGVPFDNAAPGDPRVVGPGGNTDSVDADDGLINGSGTLGRAYFNLAGSSGIEFAFNAIALGGLPTHAGIVWTDGAGVITFTAYDAAGNSLGSVNGLAPGVSGAHNGETAEDTFFGVTNAGGISRIHIRNASGGIEVDHLQYGAAIPEPPSLVLLAVGFLLLLSRRFTSRLPSAARGRARGRR